MDTILHCFLSVSGFAITVLKALLCVMHRPLRSRMAYCWRLARSESWGPVITINSRTFLLPPKHLLHPSAVAPSNSSVPQHWAAASVSSVSSCLCPSLHINEFIQCAVLCDRRHLGSIRFLKFIHVVIWIYILFLSFFFL